MLVYAVDVFVVSGHEDDFLKAIEENHLATRKEEGNIRFDVSQSQDDSSQFFLYEVYKDEAAVKAHKETSHYLKWRETVAPWMAKPRQGRCLDPHFPQDGSQW